MPTYHLIIKGKVQGVFYRATAKDEAVKLGLKGWVKNTAEGNVEAFITGSYNDTDAFIKWCYRGPSKAKVTEVIVIEKEEKNLEDFKIIRD